MSPAPPRVRVYYPYFPYPATEGSFQVALDQARALARASLEVELVSWKDPPASIARKLAAPSPTPFEPSIRITSLHGGAVRSGGAAEWLDAGAGTGAGGEREGALARTARVASAALSPWASPELFYYPLEADLRDRLPEADVGIYHYSFCYPWLRRNGAGPERRAFVHYHNLESELAALRAEAESGGRLPGAALHRLNAAKLAAHEGELAGLAEELWFVSARDLERVGVGDRARLRLVPPTFDLAHYAGRREGCPQAPGGHAEVGFLGGCHFEPNRRSLEWIVTRVAPALAERGYRGRILVAGRDVPEELKRRAAPFGFVEWLGFVPDLEEFWSRLSFLLVPQRGGSGVRIKLLEAIVSGVPVLANAEALEALAPDVAAHPLVFRSDDPRAWADRIMAEAPPRAARRALAGAAAEGSSLDAEATYRFLLESLGKVAAMRG